MINLTVIIPTLNRAESLKIALNSMVKQTLPQTEFELIVVDNGSTDKTKEIVESFRSKIANLQYWYEQKPGLHAGRHLGLEKSKSNILVYADDDIEAFPGWLAAIKDTLKDKKVHLVGGKNLPKFAVDPPCWLKEIWSKERRYGKAFSYLAISDLGDEVKEIDPYYVWGCNFSIRKSVLLEAEGFHPDGVPPELIKYRGDGEGYVSRFVLAKGYKAIYNPKASIYHLISKEKMTLGYLCQKAYMAGVSESYAETRYRKEGCSVKKQANWLKRVGLIENYLKRIPSKLKKFLKKKREKEDESRIVEERLGRSYREGFNYHQKEVFRDKKLLEWVKKRNYLEGSLLTSG